MLDHVEYYLQNKMILHSQSSYSIQNSVFNLALQ